MIVQFPRLLVANFHLPLQTKIKSNYKHSNLHLHFQIHLNLLEQQTSDIIKNVYLSQMQQNRLLR